MLCEHLKPLEEELLGKGYKPTFRGQAWSSNCREWIYFDLVFDVESVAKRLKLPEFVKMHENTDSHSGLECGLVCDRCHDAVMGRHPTEPGGCKNYA